MHELPRIKIFLSVIAALFLSGCARVAEPLPPLILIPKRTDALQLKQIGDRIRLSFPIPKVNTDGSPVQTLREIHIFRSRLDRSPAAATPEVQSFRRAAQTAVVLKAEELDKYKVGESVEYADDTASDREQRFRSSFYYAVEYVNRKGQSDGLSNICKVEPLAIPEAPAGIRVTVSLEGIRLEWDVPQTNLDGTGPARVNGYNIYRSLVSPPQFDRPLNPAPQIQSYYLDTDFAFGRGVHYAVTVVAKTTDPAAESPLSKSVLVEPRDTFAPAAPQRLEAFAIVDTVTLRWDANRESDLAGYFVYRSESEAERGTRLTDKPVFETGFIDRTVLHQKTYYYRISAIDRLGNESPPTSAVPLILP